LVGPVVRWRQFAQSYRYLKRLWESREVSLVLLGEPDSGKSAVINAIGPGHDQSFIERLRSTPLTSIREIDKFIDDCSRFRISMTAVDLKGSDPGSMLSHVLRLDLGLFRSLRPQVLVIVLAPTPRNTRSAQPVFDPVFLATQKTYIGAVTSFLIKIAKHRFAAVAIFINKLDLVSTNGADLEASQNEAFAHFTPTLNIIEDFARQAGGLRVIRYAGSALKGYNIRALRDGILGSVLPS
jgi:hypothetical protein